MWLQGKHGVAALQDCGLQWPFHPTITSFHKCQIITSYENLYKSASTVGLEEVLSHVPCRVDANMNEMLDASYSAKEVKEALF